MNGNGRHQLTVLESREGTRQSKLSRRAELRLARKQLESQVEARRLELVRTALSQPVISGTLMFFTVLGIENIIKAGSPSSAHTAGQDPIQVILKGLGGALGGANPIAGDLLGATSGSIASLIGNVDLAALKAVILIYIASGGNLVGILQSGGNALTSLLSSIGIGAAAP